MQSLQLKLTKPVQQTNFIQEKRTIIIQFQITARVSFMIFQYFLTKFKFIILINKYIMNQNQPRQREFAQFREQTKSSAIFNNNSFNTPTQSQLRNPESTSQKNINTNRTREYQKQLAQSRKQEKANKVKEVCVNCVNKIVANKKKLAQLERKEKQRAIEKERLERERDEIVKQQMKHLQKLKQEQNTNRNKIFENQKLKKAEEARKMEQAKKLINENQAAYQQQQKLMELDREKRDKFKKQLQQQIELQKQAKAKQKQQEKKVIKHSALFDEEQITAINKAKQQQYRNSLINQIKQKDAVVKQQRMKNIEEEKKYLPNVYEPQIEVRSFEANQYADIKKQIEQREQAKKQNQIKTRTQQNNDRQLMKQEEQQQRKLYTEEKMNQMKKYIQDLAKQMQDNRKRKREELEQRAKPGYTQVPFDLQNQFKNCSNCDLKFPANYLSKIEQP